MYFVCLSPKCIASDGRGSYENICTSKAATSYGLLDEIKKGRQQQGRMLDTMHASTKMFVYVLYGVCLPHYFSRSLPHPATIHMLDGETLCTAKNEISRFAFHVCLCINLDVNELDGNIETSNVTRY